MDITSALLLFFSPDMEIIFFISSFVLSIELDSSFKRLITFVFSSCFIVPFPFSIFTINAFCCSMRPSNKSCKKWNVGQFVIFRQKIIYFTYSLWLQDSALLRHSCFSFFLCLLHQLILSLEHFLILFYCNHFLIFQFLYFFRIHLEQKIEL